MKPFLNLDELDDFQTLNEEPFLAVRSIVGEKLGMRKLGCSVVKVPPNSKAWPFHNHYNNEEIFVVLKGSGTLRFGKNEYQIKTGDVVCCPCGGNDVAHQILNTGHEELSYFCISTNEVCEVCEYPDSQKVLARGYDGENFKFRHISKLGDGVDYFYGES